ncbi:hypothetical protein QFZ77_001355 [Paenibacillus sp. V4I3]|uniref:hypothetical protein n=1 Tax=unclassified Paenibacillus TaxID=185978 RepID=UPI00277D509C|nr:MULTISPECIES: hypothetical protein [unclassified Paenibacillus]MDQ0872696.1 hypothetical protein [Paenibacillus sp. V4I3]MDQ0891421.1 hypothetical protein [Paenibacillus sp. V4I9]
MVRPNPFAVVWESDEGPWMEGHIFTKSTAHIAHWAEREVSIGSRCAGGDGSTKEMFEFGYLAVLWIYHLTLDPTLISKQNQLFGTNTFDKTNGKQLRHNGS